jgi:hypothetical protein
MECAKEKRNAIMEIIVENASGGRWMLAATGTQMD